MPADSISIFPGKLDRLNYQNANELSDDISQFGYYGGVRLLKASIHVFHRYCQAHGISQDSKNFQLSYSSNIPNRLGLAGSSAIITAAFRCMMKYYEVNIPNPILANLILSVEKDELNIGGGLQDRVAQVYGCPVYMDFNRELMEQQGFGNYIPFSKAQLPPLYIAYRNSQSEGSEVTHNDLAKRYASGDVAVLAAIEKWKQLSEKVWQKLQNGDTKIGPYLNQNFDIRASVCTIAPGNMQMIEAARRTGASAKFTGSGGAIIGTYETEQQLEKLCLAMKTLGATVIKPEIAGDETH
jgi:glucuronokinase